MRIVEFILEKFLDWTQRKSEKCSTLIIPNPNNPNDEFFLCLDFMEYEKEHKIILNKKRYLIKKTYTHHLVFTRIRDGD